MNAEKLETVASESLDLYTIAFGIRNVSKKDEALREAYRVLRKGGRFMCLEMSKVQIPVFREAYDFFLFNVVPPLGKVIT